MTGLVTRLATWLRGCGKERGPAMWKEPSHAQQVRADHRALQAALVAEEEAVRAHRALTVASHRLASTIAAAPTGTPQDFAALAALLDRRRRGAGD